METKSKSFDLFNLTPLFLLIWGVYSVLFRDVIPVASGFGWDGIEYGKIALNFEGLIGSLDTYRAGRIFPSILIYYVLRLFQLPHNLETVLIAFQIYAIIILVLSSFLYIKIAKIIDLKPIAKWIGFIALFINYPILNLHFYYPALTDGTVFFFSLVYIYSYLTNKYLLLLFTSILAFFTWPTMILIGIVLFVFSKNRENYWNVKINFITTFILISILISPLLFGYLYNVGYGSFKLLVIKFNLFSLNNPDIIKPFSLYKLVLALLNILFLYFVFYFIISKINIQQIIKYSFTKQSLLKIAATIAIIALLVYLKSFIEDKELAAFSTKEAILRITDLSLVFPIQYLVSHISYYGPIIILLIIFYNQFIESLKGYFTPVLFILIIMLFFSIGVESRGLINFYPFVVIFLIPIIDFEKIKYLKSFIVTFVISSIIYSKIWLSVGLPSTEFPNCPMENLDKFPMQSYFLNFGPWQNFQMYIVHALVAVFLFFIFYFLVSKRKANNV